MDYQSLSTENQNQVQRVLGYLNFSTGNFDPKFFRDLDDLFFDLNVLNQAQSVYRGRTAVDSNNIVSPIAGNDAINFNQGEQDSADNPGNSDSSTYTPTYLLLYQILKQGLEELGKSSDTFKNSVQAKGVLSFTFDHLLPAYKDFHKDLLYHKTAEQMFTSFFIARVFQYVIEAESPWDDFKQADIIHRLNDYVGYRPTAVLHSRQKMQPYPHEFYQPLPLFIQGAGIGKGPYAEVCQVAMNILRDTDESILFKACFDLGTMKELAIDIRTLDFDHPVNRRLNYPFGSWDTSSIDNTGYFRRYIIHQTTLDAICGRIENCELPYDEAVFEAGAVLAGTMLMGASIDGMTPDAHDSSVTLSTLLPIVAQYRDEFYESLLKKAPAKIQKRLTEEIQKYRQPFGAARQYFNHLLSRLRADQLQNLQLARLFAWMGYTHAAEGRAGMVKCVAARMRCQIECLLTNCHSLIDDNNLEAVIPLISQIEDILDRGIQCGAFVDPWNILGFGGQYPLFASAEDSTPDHRVDELINLMGAIFNLYSRSMRQASVEQKPELKSQLSVSMKRRTDWWDQYASSELSSIDSISGEESWESANIVADALAAWRKAGTAAGDIKFWRPQVEKFASTKAYALLIEELMDQKDPVAAMALLINWLGNSDTIILDDGDYSFHPLALRWMEEQWFNTSKMDRIEGRRGKESIDGWDAAKKFVDFLEPNAGAYWEIPSLEIDHGKFPSFNQFKKDMNKLKDKPKDNENYEDLFLHFMGMPKPSAEDDNSDDETPDDNYDPFDSFSPEDYPPNNDDEDDDNDDDNPYRSAYENVVYRDSTDDGNDSDMMDSVPKDPLSDFPLTEEMDRISDRLLFWVTVARMWKMSAIFSLSYAQAHPERDDTLLEWHSICRDKLEQITHLIREVEQFKVPVPTDSRQSMLDYEQRRAVKDTLLERLQSTYGELEDSCRLLASTSSKPVSTAVPTWESLGQRVLQAMLHSDVQTVKDNWKPFLSKLGEQTLLYQPVSRGGSALKIARSKGVQTVIQRLLNSLPKLGLTEYSFDLLLLSQRMEREHPVGIGAVTRFDKIFEVGCQGLVSNIVQMSASRKRNWSVISLTETLEKLAEILLICWLNHSQGIRVSTIESVGSPMQWNRLQHFIKTYGKDLFCPMFMGYGNLQAILHQTVPVWLKNLQQSEEPEVGQTLLNDLDIEIPFNEAVHWLELVFESILEYYGQYIDYNSTTTLSDKGDMLYALLDFLRLQAGYDRIAWKLLPVSTIHSSLVNEGKKEAADFWLKAVARRCEDAANAQWERYTQLQTKHGILMTGIGDRIGERFVRPLEVAQLCSLIQPAMEEIREKKTQTSFEQFIKGITELANTPTGNGFEPPAWLEAVEKESQRIRNVSEDEDEMLDLSSYIVPVQQTKSEIIKVITSIKRRLDAGID